MDVGADLQTLVWSAQFSAAAHAAVPDSDKTGQLRAGVTRMVLIIRPRDQSSQVLNRWLVLGTCWRPQLITRTDARCVSWVSTPEGMQLTIQLLCQLKVEAQPEQWTRQTMLAILSPALLCRGAPPLRQLGCRQHASNHNHSSGIETMRKFNMILVCARWFVQLKKSAIGLPSHPAGPPVRAQNHQRG